MRLVLDRIYRSAAHVFSCYASDVVQGLDGFISVGLGRVNVEDWPGYVEMRGGVIVERVENSKS